MRKLIQRIFRWTAVILLLLLLSVVIGAGYLYFSADMKQPAGEHIPPAEVVRQDTCDLRCYAGSLMRHSDTGLWEMYIPAYSPQRRGVCIGKLASDLLYEQETAFVNQIYELVPSDAYLKFLRFSIVLFNRNLGENVPEEYRNEIYGISQECTHAYDFIGTPYERQLNYHAAHDLGHAMQDYSLVGCSSFATWGTQSADSSLLIGRNFDFYVGDDFARNKLVTFMRVQQGYGFVSVGWPGMIGVLSGMNEAGLTVTLNAAKSAIPTASATPISILAREILQYASTIDEAYALARKRKTFVSESLLIGSAKDGKAAIIEKSPEKTVLYFSKEQNRIVCTNHFQSDEFACDERNRENLRTSDSPYRYARLEELIDRNLPLDAPKAASILRDHKGLHDADLGLGNEMAINQFIAHHSVIFQPEKRLIWVSTSPWQCGKYVAYDLNKIFDHNGIAGKAENYLPELTLPDDPFMGTPAFRQLLIYKKLTPLMKMKIRKKEPVEDCILKIYEHSNPSFYHTYEVIGDYYLSRQQPQQALVYWQKALERPIPRQQEKERIEQKIKKENNGKAS